jgi:catechol 2,3-dioxygenase-like lactoylglutathione lyase family enzyme
MAVSFLKHVALEIPEADRDIGIQFYQDFGLHLTEHESHISFGCYGRVHDSIILIPGASKKKLHHVAMGASVEGIAQVRRNLVDHNIELLDSPTGFVNEGLWFKSSQGVLFNVIIAEREIALPPVENVFTINQAPDHVRINSIVMPPKSQIGEVRPQQLSHAVLFTPDVPAMLAFVEDILGLRLSDRSGDFVAFTHVQGGSDHHVLAFAASNGIGFNHICFSVNTPDDVGIGGNRMAEKYGPGWGFGRHAIGSNFFYYVPDPWGSFCEYSSDMDYIGDSENWIATDWPAEDSLYTWGPEPSPAFLLNSELDAE